MAKGWWFPLNAGKAHYFNDNITSLCGRWGKFNNAPLEDANHTSKDNCKACMKEREKLAQEEEKING
jgi:hypothetical protein